MQPNSKDEKFKTDLTISNVKNISLEVLVGGDSALLEAHCVAVSRTIDLIESRYAQTQINGQPVRTDNLTVVELPHDTSRELEAHLHTHRLAVESGDKEC